MRNPFLILTLAGLVGGAPAAAQSTHRTAARLSEPMSGSARVFVAVLEGSYDVPPIATPATGTVELTLAGNALRYQVHVDSIRDVSGVYLHIGHPGDVAPAVADLFDGVKAGPVSGLLSRGTLTRAQLHETTMARLVRALKNDDVYVTVHALALHGGELRGQLRAQPIVARR
jgi:CHRD domain